MPETPPKFYLTTPIYYVNARPHIGHAYTTIVADVLARRARSQGQDTWFLTGTDEHGQKIERSALAAGVPPQAFTDEVSQAFRSLWDRMGLTYDQYIRTTDDAHKRGVQQLWRTLEANGKIYLSSYTGQYCVSEEIFVEGPPGTIGPDGRPTETVTEENYFFRLSEYQRPLIDLIESNTLEITPDSRRNELLSFLRGNVSQASAVTYPVGPSDVPPNLTAEPEPEAATPHPTGLAYSTAGNPYVPGALRDLSISRSSFTWGIPVPGNPKHVIYVWLDALANYLTAVGYGDDSPEAQAKFARYWPADLHLVGKEIIRQHCIYWPAFLLAADLPLPKKVVAHGWLLFEESKMSKSKGNIVRTETILDAFGTLCPGEPTPKDRDLFAADVLRYFLLREIPFGQDGSFSFDALITRYNADLANGYGNLVSRTLKMIQDYFAGEISIETKSVLAYDAKERVRFAESGIAAIVVHHINRCVRIAQAPLLETAFNVLVGELNLAITVTDKFISENAPWKLAKETGSDARAKLTDVLAETAQSIRIITALLHPILPFATANVWRQLGLGDITTADLTNLEWGGLQPGTRLGPLSPIFPRADKGLAQNMTDQEAAQSIKPTPSKLVDESFTASPQTPQASTHPGAPPATSTLAEHAPGTQVAASQAITTERPQAPSHTEAQASGIFAGDTGAGDVGAGTPEPAPATGPADASPQITIDDFAKVELRVAQVIVCERIPKADKLLRLEVDLGYEKRQILSGIAEWYTPEDLIGRRIVVITNLAPRKMRGLESHGMLLAASSEGGKPALATFLDSDTLPLGSRLK